MKALFRAVAAVVLLLLAACTHHHHPHDEKAAAEETISITKWTDKSELFVEFAPLLVGKETPFAAHLTDLETFKPVAEGTLKVSFTPADGKEIFVEAQSPTVAGIYRPVAKVDRPGTYRLAFHRYRPGSTEIYDTIEAGEVRVSENPEPAAQAAESSQGGGITFLKEQQWRIDFATAPVRTRELAPLLKMSAEVKPAATGQVQIVAPLGGTLVKAGSGAPVPGRKVKQGEELAVLLPTPGQSRVELDSELRSAQSELAAAESELERVRALYQDKIVARVGWNSRSATWPYSEHGSTPPARNSACSIPAIRPPRERPRKRCASPYARRSPGQLWQPM